jgi:hypothetical protein
LVVELSSQFLASHIMDAFNMVYPQYGWICSARQTLFIILW